MFDVGSRWIFADFKVPSKKDIAQLQLMGATDVVLGLNNQEESAFKLRASRNQDKAKAKLIKVGRGLKQKGMRVHLMPWLRPTEAYNRECSRVVKELYEGICADSVLFDAEVYFNKKPKGMTHVEFMETIWQSCWADLDMMFGVTSYAMVPKAIRAILGQDRIAYYVPQAYSIYNTKMEWTTGSTTLPGSMQQAAYDSWRLYAKDHQRCVMGIAVYSLKRPGIDGIKNIETCLGKCTNDLEVPVAIWSLNHTYNRRVTAFFKEN